MSIFVDKNSRVVVQGITGKEGQFHTCRCVVYGTRVVLSTKTLTIFPPSLTSTHLFLIYIRWLSTSAQ